jgi:hypothetical protein
MHRKKIDYKGFRPIWSFIWGLGTNPLQVGGSSTVKKKPRGNPLLITHLFPSETRKNALFGDEAVTGGNNNILEKIGSNFKLSQRKMSKVWGN